MRTTLNLLNEVMALGFERQEALKGIDAVLDDKYGFENRKPIAEEILPDELYDNMLAGFAEDVDERD